MQKITGYIRLGYRVPFLLLWTIFMFLLLVMVINITARSYVVRLYFRVVVYMLGLRVQMNKRIHENGVIICPNHMTYLDILIMGAYFKGFFVAAIFMKDLPFYGWGASLIRTIFITKGKQGMMKHLLEKGSKFLKEGGNIIIFPEGDSNDNPIQPFKPGAFVLAAQNHAPIIPVVIKYPDVKKVAWGAEFSETPMLKHMLQFLADKTHIEVQLTIMPKIYPFYFQTMDTFMKIIHKAMQQVYDSDGIDYVNQETLDVIKLNKVRSTVP